MQRVDAAQAASDVFSTSLRVSVYGDHQYRALKMTSVENPNPIIHHINRSAASKDAARTLLDLDSPYFDEESRDPFDAEEVFDLIRDINDPEHPLTLEQLNVAQLEQVHVDDEHNKVEVLFTPTIPHCSMATLIGLCIRVKLYRSLPSRFKLDVRIAPGTHASEAAVNKQLADKERVAAALENSNIISVVNRCLSPENTA